MSTIKFTYTFPESLGGGKVTMRELRLEEQINKSEAFDGLRLAHELTKLSLVKLDGVDVTPESRDEQWNAMSTKKRNLCIAAFRDIHSPKVEESEGFLEGVQVEVATE